MYDERKKKKQSQKQVYTALGWKQQNYSKKELGQRRLSEYEASQLAHYHGKPEDYFKHNGPADDEPIADAGTSPAVAAAHITKEDLIAFGEKLGSVVAEKVIDTLKNTLLKELKTETQERKKPEKERGRKKG